MQMTPHIQEIQHRNNKRRKITNVILLTVCAAILFSSGFFISYFLSAKRLAAAAANYTLLENELDAEKKRTSEFEKQLKTLNDEKTDLDNKLQNANNELTSFKEIKGKEQSETKPASANSGQKYVALTFDDGPGEFTGNLLDELKSHNMKATFFVLGNRVAKHSDLLHRMLSEGHEIGSHSYEHKNLIKLSGAQIADDLLKTTNAIKAASGRAPVLMRPPYGNCNETVKKCAASNGQCVILWTVDTLDWKSRNEDAIMTTAFQNGFYGIHDGAIILMHDIYNTSVNAANRMMDRLQAQGYQSVTVSELLRMRKNGGVPGTSYNFIGQ